LRLRCAFTAEDYQEGEVQDKKLLGVRENQGLLADLIWLIHHFCLEDEADTGTVATYKSKLFLPKEVAPDKVPLIETRTILEELWTKAPEDINLDHVTKKLQRQALELYSRIEM